MQWNSIFMKVSCVTLISAPLLLTGCGGFMNSPAYNYGNPSVSYGKTVNSAGAPQMVNDPNRDTRNNASMNSDGGVAAANSVGSNQNATVTPVPVNVAPMPGQTPVMAAPTVAY